jgi:hypothetical protein
MERHKHQMLFVRLRLLKELGLLVLAQKAGAGVVLLEELDRLEGFCSAAPIAVVLVVALVGFAGLRTALSSLELTIRESAENLWSELRAIRDQLRSIETQLEKIESNTDPDRQLYAGDPDDGELG